MSLLDVFRRDPGDPPDRDDLSAIVDAIANARRRFVIEYVTAEGATTRQHLANVLARREHGPGYASRHRMACYTALYQTHLPALNAAGVIDYDEPSGAVRPTVETARYAEAIDAVREVFA